VRRHHAVQLPGHGTHVDVPIALACDNSFALKISEKVPSTAIRMAELLSETGLPDGVFNLKKSVDRSILLLICCSYRKSAR
jgi:acyl-CoA reductase-like NAD-dependent aldehyde dehydrogenase